MAFGLPNDSLKSSRKGNKLEITGDRSAIVDGGDIAHSINQSINQIGIF